MKHFNALSAILNFPTSRISLPVPFCFGKRRSRTARSLSRTSIQRTLPKSLAPLAQLLLVLSSPLSAQIEFGEPKQITTINNVSAAVWSPSLTPDELELYYTHWHEDGEWDIYWASRTSVEAAWHREGPVPAPLPPAMTTT